MKTETTTSLLITEMLEGKLKEIDGYYYCECLPDMKILLEGIIQKVRTMELSLIEKAKEEERERIAKVISDMQDKIVDDITGDYATESEQKIAQFEIDTLDKIIKRITSDNQ